MWVGYLPTVIYDQHILSVIFRSLAWMSLLSCHVDCCCFEINATEAGRKKNAC